MYKKKGEKTQGPVPQGPRPQGPETHGGEHEQRRGPPPRRTRPPMQREKEHIEVTIDTVVPPMPVKHEILQKPNWENQYEKEYEGYKRELDSFKKEKGLLYAEANKMFDGQDANKKYEVLLVELRKSSARKNELFERQHVAKDAYEVAKKNYYELLNSLGHQRENLQFFSLEEVDDEIARLSKKLETSTLSIKEEQKITQTIKDLAKTKEALPTYQTENSKVGDLKDRYKATKDAQNKAWNELQVVLKSHDELKRKMDLLNKEWTERKESFKVDEKKIELINKGAENVREKMSMLVNKFYDDEDNYYAQLKLIRKIEWMAREKERALYFEERRRQREEEEKARVPEHPHQAELDACDQLLAYCRKFTGEKKEEEVKEKEVKVESGALQAKLKKGELQPVEDKKKKEEEGLLIIGGGGKKKQREKRKGKARGKDSEAKFNIDLGTLALFDKVQIAPFFQPKDIPATYERILEKRKYFSELPEKAPKEETQPAAEEKPAATEAPKEQ